MKINSFSRSDRFSLPWRLFIEDGKGMGKNSEKSQGLGHETWDWDNLMNGNKKKK